MVSEDSTVAAIAPRTATITVTLSDRAVKTNCRITVRRINAKTYMDIGIGGTL